MRSSIVTCIRDQYHRALALTRYLQHYPEDKYNQGKLKDEQHKLENAVRMLNGAEINMDNAKRPRCSGFIVCQDQLSRFIGNVFEMCMEATKEEHAHMIIFKIIYVFVCCSLVDVLSFGYKFL
jgi:hypothetical protein